MKEFIIDFAGRPNGAIGILWDHRETVQAENALEAIEKLSDGYEHVSVKAVNGIECTRRKAGVRYAKVSGEQFELKD